MNTYLSNNAGMEELQVKYYLPFAINVVNAMQQWNKRQQNGDWEMAETWEFRKIENCS